ncbi:MAG: PP2C family protein-serine/threonine phosphatase [Acidimicrobiia bacterium]
MEAQERAMGSWWASRRRRRLKPAPAAPYLPRPVEADLSSSAAATADRPSPETGPIRVLLVEDDPGDAFLVQELLGADHHSHTVVWASSMAEARARPPGVVDCVIVDLGLPDARDMAAVRAACELCPDAAVIVLTGLSDRGIDALAQGAQDYLVKGEVDGQLLVRAVRYAVERRRFDETARLLASQQLEQAYNARLAGGLTPRPRFRDPDLAWTIRYRAAGSGPVLGGDFLDAIELPDRTVRALIGDVCGHGPDEASLGVRLRMAWRTLVMGGLGFDDVLPRLDAVLEVERETDLFVTICDILVTPDRATLGMRVAGHPPPLLLGEEACVLDVAHGLPLGLFPGERWPQVTRPLASAWTLVLYTDGLIEGRDGTTGERWGVEGLAAFADELVGLDPDAVADGLVERATALHGGPLADDIALLVLRWPAAPAP